MSGKNVVILDGCGSADQDLAPILAELWQVLAGDGSEIETFHLRDMKLSHCLGCFGCLVKTPGMCVECDAGRQVARAFIQSDTAVLFTPVTFGGYSPDLKKMVDHFIQLISPYFQMEHGELHHPPRYAHRPRLLVIGVQRRPDFHEAHIFKTLAGRNAINLHPAEYAAEVVPATEPGVILRLRFEALLNRSDPLPFGEATRSLMPEAVAGIPACADVPKRALLIAGSPKTGGASASGILGGYLLDRLGISGWETESLTLRASLGREEGEAAFLGAVNRAGLIVLAFPLYADSLPYLVTKALSVIGSNRQAAATAAQRMAVIVNSGFPEQHQNAVALAICREFASQTGIAWYGGLALGGGGIIGARPLTEANRPGPPVKHAIRALDLAAAALAEGHPVPAEALGLMARSPIPFVPFATWRWLYLRLGGKSFEKEAARNGVAKERLMDQPYARSTVSSAGTAG